MGLDMYLKAEKYISGYEFAADEDKEHYQNICKELKANEFKDPDSPSLTVSIHVGYWRKANAIHAWFVEHIQDGEDDCGNYYFSRQDLNELLETCKTVLADTSKATELLPPQEGFFFGSTAIDEWYFKNIEHTIAIIEKLNAHLPENWDLQYHSSW